MAKQKQKPITFKDWINEIGVDSLSRALDVQVTTVRHWRRGHCLPRVDQMREIKKMTRGLIGYEQIIEGKLSKPTNRNVGSMK